jgi:metal-responsive CopG/Arc/MetJ family transcriptional regulator
MADTKAISLRIEADLLTQLDQWSSNRTAAISEAIRLWLAEQERQQLAREYALLAAQEQDDEGWVTEAEANWDAQL